MSVRIKFKLDFSISSDPTGGNELGQTDPWFGICDMMDNGGTFKRKIGAGTSNVLVGINGLATARFLAILTDQTITIAKNSTSGETWTIRPLGVGATDGIWISTIDSVTALYVSNPGSVDAEVTFSIAGVDP